MSSKITDGIAIYTIGLNGCLNGLYTNGHSTVGGQIYNEIARKNPGSIEDLIAGEYECTYFEVGNVRHDVKLVIEPLNGGYQFCWLDRKSNLRLFLGQGFKMNEHLIAVHYTTA